ncbi:glutaredoxin domain-containing protein [Chloroflexota bacterium]
MRAKEYLSQKGILYEEHDVAADRAAATEMVEKSKQMAVPVIIVDDKDIVVGFNQAKLDELLS